MAGLYLIGFAAPGLRGGRLPRRRDDRPGPERAPRDVRAARRWRRSTSSCCPWSGSACSARRRSSGDLTHGARARRSRRCSAALRQGGGDLVHGAQHVPRHAAAAGRRGAHAVAARRGRPAAAHPRPAHPHRRAVGRDAADRRHGDRVPADRRPALADRRRQLHLPDRHRPAERRGLAAAPQRARDASGPIARRAARSCSGVVAAGVWGVATVLGFQQFGLPTVLVGLGARLLGLGALRVAQLVATGGEPGACRRRALAARQADRRDAAGAWSLDGAGYLLAVAHVDRGHAPLGRGARGHLRRGRAADDQPSAWCCPG